jgi:formylglycine-generating enzyme required for sulfatase activity
MPARPPPRWPSSITVVALTVAVGAHARAQPPLTQRVPTIDEVVEREGFTPTRSQSEIYRPGAVLLANSRGGHDVIVKDCAGVVPDVSLMSQSAFASSLAGGVSARLGPVNGEVDIGVEKRLTFVDPEQRTIPIASLEPSAACTAGLERAARLTSLDRAIVVYDVLVAQVKSSKCTRADASGRVMVLGVAEAAAYSECVQESPVPIPLGYKAVPLTRLLAAVAPPAGAAAATPPSPAAAATPDAVSAAHKADYRACLRAEADALRGQAQADWARLSSLLGATDPVARGKAMKFVNEFIARYEGAEARCAGGAGERAEPVTIPELDAALAWRATADASGGAGGAGRAGARVVGSSGYALRLVPAGLYAVGCRPRPGADCGADEGKARTITLSRGVLVGEAEVTQGLYAQHMGANPAKFGACGATCPVESLTWREAATFANRLSAAEGLEPCYVSTGGGSMWVKGIGCTGFRLPTEAEWEIAARADTDAAFAGAETAAPVAWFEGNSEQRTHPVGKKAPNAWGFYDMSGNVWEWVWDRYASTPAVGDAVDPLGAPTGGLRVCRGGSWRSADDGVRISNRYGLEQDERSPFVGLRLVRTAP